MERSEHSHQSVVAKTVRCRDGRHGMLEEAGEAPQTPARLERRCHRGQQSHSRFPGLPPSCGQPCVQEPPVKVLGLKKALLS